MTMKIDPYKILNTIDQYVFSKDQNGRYTYVNDQFAQIAGVSSANDVLGKTDHELIWCDQADLYHAADKEVLLGKSFYKQEQIQHRGTKSVRIMITRVPLYSEVKTVVGIVGCFFDCHNKLLLEATGEYDYDKKRLYLEFVPEWLSLQEVRVCFYLLHGFTGNKIATKVGTTESTVRFHIENIKNKMQCKNKSEIPEKCMKTGIAWQIFSLQHINNAG